MIIPSDEETRAECEQLGENAVRAKLKTDYFVNAAAAHEWLFEVERAADKRRIERSEKFTKAALVASWVAASFSVLGVLWQIRSAGVQQENMKAQLEQQKEDSQRQLGNAKALLDVQISMELDRQFDSPEMRQARRRLANQLLQHKEVTETRLIDFFDKVGMYTHKKLVDKDIIEQSYSYWLVRYWPSVKSSVERFRKQENDPGFYNDAEALYKEMAAADNKDGVAEPSQEEIRRFLREEATLSL